MKANNDVTEALQRTIVLMQGELEKSVLSTQLLGTIPSLLIPNCHYLTTRLSPTDASSASLRSTSTTHDVLDGLLVTSKHLITALEKSDWIDRMLVLAGLAFFILVVAFILKQRIVDRGLRIAFWWTRFIPDFSSDERLLNMEEAKTAASVVTGTVASVAASASSAVAAAAASASSSPAPVLASSSPLGGPTSSLDKDAALTPLEVLNHALFSESSSVGEDGAQETGSHDEL